MTRFINPQTQQQKRPDEFVSIVDHIARLIWDYRRPLMAIMVVLLLGVGFYLFQNYRRDRELMQLATRLYELSDKEFSEQAYHDLIEGYGQYPVAQLLKAKLFNNLIAEQNWEGAIKLISEQQGQLPEVMRPLWSLNLAKLYWKAEDHDRAVETLDQIPAPNYLGSQVDWVKGQILEDKGDINGALELYAKLADDDSAHALQKRAQMKQILIQSQLPAPKTEDAQP